MYEANTVEELNRPAVALVNAGFADDGRTSASSKGRPCIRIVPETVPCESSVMEQIEAGVTAAMENILKALTDPLTAEEKSPQPKVEKFSRIVFSGNLKEVNRFFYSRGWTDGLPIVPPTEEEVAEMLTGTDLPPDHLVGRLGPSSALRLGKATVERIAINAVMAGCLPTYMPVLIAGVENLLDPETRFGLWSISAGSWAPFWIINGPVRNDLHLNCGQGVLSPGDIANAAIGRAMGLIIKNIGGIRKAIEDMGTLGNPGKYSMVIGENEENSPWEPLHVEHGFTREDSTITVHFPSSESQVSPYGSDDAGILRVLVNSIRRGGRVGLLITPQNARALAGKGWKKKDVVDFITQFARVPATEVPAFWGTTPGMSLRGAGLRGNKVPMIASDSVPVLDPGLLRVVVAGGAGPSMGIYSGGHSGAGWVTKKIVFPANWDKLVQKYNNVAPKYHLY